MPSKSDCGTKAHAQMAEAKALWDNIWAYCTDCGEWGDTSLPCKTCHPEDEEELEEVEESQESGGSANDWNQISQVGNKELKLDKWLIDSGASVHVTNQKEDLHEPKPMMQAVMIGSGKAMMAEAMGIKPTKLWD